MVCEETKLQKRNFHYTHTHTKKNTLGEPDSDSSCRMNPEVERMIRSVLYEDALMSQESFICNELGIYKE